MHCIDTTGGSGSPCEVAFGAASCRVRVLLPPSLARMILWFGDFAFQSATTFFSAESPVSCVDNLFSHGRLRVEDVFVLITAATRSDSLHSRAGVVRTIHDFVLFRHFRRVRILIGILKTVPCDMATPKQCPSTTQCYVLLG